MPKNTDSEHLRRELKNMANTLEEVLGSSADKPKHELEKLHRKARAALDETRHRLGESSERIARHTREAASRADDFVHEKPWHGICVGAALGVIVGVLLTRR